MFYVIFVDEMEGEVKEGLEGHEKTRNMRGDNEDRAWKDVKYAQQMLNLHWWQNKTVSAQTSWSAASMLVQNKKRLKIIPFWVVRSVFAKKKRTFSQTSTVQQKQCR